MKNRDNKSPMVSDHTTAGDSRRSTKDGGAFWNNYSGTKKSHDTQVTQMNYKEKDGTHTFVNPKTGVEGQAGPNYKRNKK